MDVCRGERESIALQNHQKSNLRFHGCKIETHTSARSQTKRDECPQIVVGGFSDPFRESLRLEKLHIVAPDLRVVVKLQIRDV